MKLIMAICLLSMGCSTWLPGVRLTGTGTGQTRYTNADAASQQCDFERHEHELQCPILVDDCSSTFVCSVKVGDYK